MTDTMRDHVDVPAVILAIPPEVQLEIEGFYFLEARLLDERRYREWLALLADDVHYWMPIRTNRTTSMLMAPPDDPAAAIMEQVTAVPGRQFSSRLGHAMSWGFGNMDPIVNYILGGGQLAKWYSDTLPEMTERLGEARVNGPMFSNMLLFPNFGANPGDIMMRVWHPKGPHAFEVWGWVLLDSSMPDDVKAQQIAGTGKIQNVTGLIELDDLENWSMIGKNMEQTHQVRKLMLNYQMGAGDQHDADPEYPGAVNPSFLGEEPQRAFYRRWLEFMTSQRWPHVDPDEMAVVAERS